MRPPVVFLVFSHTEPALVLRLTARLLEGDPLCHVVVDHEIDGSPLDVSALRHPRVTLRTSARPGGWGGYGLVSAVLDAYAAIRRELDPDWIVLLSGQDYPVRRVSEVRNLLSKSSADVHLTILHKILPGAHDGDLRWWHARYYFRWWTLPRTPSFLPASFRRRRQNVQYRMSMGQRWVFLWTTPRESGTHVGYRRRRTPFSLSYPCWTGQQWLAASRHALSILERELEDRPDIPRLYRRSVIPDESMIQTLLMNAPTVTCTEPNLTYQRPAGAGGAHADNLTLDDLPALIASGRLFARKMHSTVSSELMDELDVLIGFTSQPSTSPP